MAVDGGNGARLRLLRERAKAAALEEALAPVSTGGWLKAEEVPRWVADAVGRFYEGGCAPVATVSDEVDADRLAVWTEELLAGHGIGRGCHVASHLSGRPWIGCTPSPGWTRVLRSAVPEPVLVLAADFRAVVGFFELEYVHAAHAARPPGAPHGAAAW